MAKSENIAKARPVDTTAALVVSKGTHYRSPKKLNVLESDNPLPLRVSPSNAEDLTGRVVGRLTVVGSFQGGKGRWVCRCLCGRYTIRRGKSITNDNNGTDRCELCRHAAYQRRTDNFRRTGRNLEWDG